MTIIKTITALTVAATMAGCAASPESITPAYVSPNAFASQSCGQLNASAAQLNARLATATGQQAKQASNDAVMTAVALLVFWPSVFFIGGNDQEPAISQMLGEVEAIRAASVLKGC